MAVSQNNPLVGLVPERADPRSRAERPPEGGRVPQELVRLMSFCGRWAFFVAVSFCGGGLAGGLASENALPPRVRAALLDGERVGLGDGGG